VISHGTRDRGRQLHPDPRRIHGWWDGPKSAQASSTPRARADPVYVPKDGGTGLLWNGQPVCQRPAEFFVPPRVAYIPQVPGGCSAEALQDNVLFGLPLTRADLPGAVWSAVMERDVEMLERGLDTWSARAE